ncbi:MAG: trigger factor [Planctomycetota bacterium]|jgi:trigger factor
MAHDHDHDHAHTHEGFDVELEHTGPCMAKVRFTVSVEEIKRTREQGLRNMAKRTKIKGFRPGKMPMPMMEKHFGEQVKLELVQHFLNHAYDDAVRTNELRPAAHPQVDPKSIPFDHTEEFKYEFELFLRPDIELKDYKGMKVDAEPFEITSEEVDEAVIDIRKRNSRPERTEEEGLEVDGMAVCRLSFKVDGIEDPVLDREGIRMSPTTPPPGVDEKEFQEALVGLTEGQERSITVPAFPDDFPTEEARGKPGALCVTATEVYKMVTPPDDEVFQAFEVEDEDGLKVAIKTRIGEAKAQQEDHRIEALLLEQLLESTTMDLPMAMVEERADLKVAELKKSLEDEEDLDAEALQGRLDVEREQALVQQARALRAMYLIEEVAKEEELLVSREDMMGEIQSIAQRNGTNAEEVGKYYQEQGLLQQLGIELLERKVRSFLRESADIQGR